MRILFAILLYLPLQFHPIEFVSVGNPNNPQTSFGKGQVSYEYQISKYEITNTEYCAFLNCVAKESDIHELFSPVMQEHFFGGIIRSEKDGGYVYSCKEGYEQTPVIGVTWMSAIRYANWLHYNAANISNNVSFEQFVRQTEGDNTHGAYDTRSVPTTRNAAALYWLPNEDEWLKAGFYDGESWQESLFTDGSNCYTDKGWAYPYPHIKNVGVHVRPSHYGTYDQQGNVAEWIEDVREGNNGWKLAKGGSLIRPSSYARPAEAEGDSPSKSIASFGLRICRTAKATELQNAQLDIYTPVSNTTVASPLLKDKLGNEYVYVGDERNPGDIVNQFKGRVNYGFLIARTELSNASYCTFLNAVAAESDPYGLYDENMSSGACGGITRTKRDGLFEYHCKDGWEIRPVVYINYYDLARFANWMHYGCPSGKCELGITEGTASQGAYDTSEFELVRSGKKTPYKKFGTRNQGARFWIPSENEWYKAAYYDPHKIGNRKYHDYPTRSSDEPTLGQANYMEDNHFSVGGPYYLAPVYSFESIPSYYGTLQQGGNVWEWIEDWQYGLIGSRGLRGGSWSYTSYGLNAVNTDPGGLDNSGYVFGGRLCMSPTDKGWKPIKTPLLDRLYESLVLMPKKYLLACLIISAMLSVLGIVSIISVLSRIIQKILCP